ncbi:MAG: XTP/dITP diphosphatase [Leptospirales bacterium]|nr:XTP/dITP diphosphatase [Leptospirales bacterium]
MKIVAASSNKNKIVEIKDKFFSIPELEIITLSEYNNIPEIIEDGDTFLANAIKKAKIIRDFTGEITIADDSGLVVDFLDGEPGVYSARYGGENLTDIDRYNLILEKMSGVEFDKRTARFICEIAIAFPNGRIISASGACEGMITYEPKGTMGFGYDPIFYIPELKSTMAEISLTEKNKISHRGRALESAYKLFLDEVVI